MSSEEARSECTSTTLEFYPFTFDVETLVLRRRGRLVKLGPQPRKVLKLLLSLPGELVTHDAIRRELWGNNPNVDAATGIYSCMARLRSALRDSEGQQKLIQTVLGETPGYCFVADVETPLAGGGADPAGTRVASSRPAASAEPPVDRGTRSRKLAVVLWLVGLGAAAVLGFRWMAPDVEPTASSKVVRFIVSNTKVSSNPTWNMPSLTITRTGDRIVFAGSAPGASTAGTTSLWYRELGGTGAVPIEGTAGADNPFSSPNGQWIAYFSRTQLWKVPAHGGRASSIYAASAPRGGSWLDDEHIVFAPGTEGGLWTIPARSGAAREPLTHLEVDRGERTHRWPHVLPNGRGILFTVGSRFISTFDEADVAVLDLRSGERKLVLRGGTQPTYSSGHLLFARAGALYAVAFDAARLEVTGEPFVLVDDLMMFPDSGAAQYAASGGGVLSYARGGPVSRQSQIYSIDRAGVRTELDVASGPYQSLALSPDGTQFVLERDGANAHLWYVDFASPNPIKLTEVWSNQLPSWTPDGAAVTYFSPRADGFHLLTTNVRTGATETLLVSPLPTTPSSWDSTGRHLLFDQQNPQTGWDIWRLDTLDETREPVVTTPASERYAVFSPDGAFITYQSDESGRWEVYVRRLGDPGLPQQISRIGGRFPKWVNDRELVYSSDTALMRHRLDPSGTPYPSAETWYESETRIVDAAVSPDGERLYVLEDVTSAAYDAPAVVVLNWLQDAVVRPSQNGR